MSDNLVSRIYSGFRGVDFRGEEVNLVRSPDSLNVWKDYKNIDSIRTRPEMRLVRRFHNSETNEPETVYGIWQYNNCKIVHVGNTLKVYIDDTLKKGFTLPVGTVNQGVSDAFIFNGHWYFKDGTNYIHLDCSTLDTSEVEHVVGYVPTTTIGRKPSGGGTKYEDVNLLSDYRINSFLADGESTKFYLDAQDIDTDFTPEVTVNGEAGKNINYHYADGMIEFHAAPSAPLTDGQDNVVIKFKKAIEGYADRIKKCTLLQVFDNRVFFSGNPDYPNVVWHCSLNNPTYCSDLDYYEEGLDTAPVRGLVAGNNALWVFREPSQANTSIFYHVPTIDSEYGKIYPSVNSSISTGCVGKAINFNDDIVFFGQRGMEGINGDVTTEQVVAHRSSMVDRLLIAEDNYKDMILAEWEGYLMVFIDNKVYLADSRAMFTTENHNEYEWFYWELGKKITCAKVIDGELFLGTEGGIYTLYTPSDDEEEEPQENIESYWVTPIDKFKYPQYLKTTNKRGCVVEATGDLSVYVKTEKSKDYELIGTYENITDYFVSRIKRKKFKDLQLKFHSNKRFSLETATLECFVGGYIKR